MDSVSEYMALSSEALKGKGQEVLQVTGVVLLVALVLAVVWLVWHNVRKNTSQNWAPSDDKISLVMDGDGCDKPGATLNKQGLLLPL